jgi:hypothetical protein
VARHIFQACPVWIHTQSNITQAYYSSLHVSPQLSLLDDYFIIRKYSELNHRDRAHINMHNLRKK